MPPPFIKDWLTDSRSVSWKHVSFINSQSVLRMFTVFLSGDDLVTENLLFFLTAASQTGSCRAYRKMWCRIRDAICWRWNNNDISGCSRRRRQPLRLRAGWRTERRRRRKEETRLPTRISSGEFTHMNDLILYYKRVYLYKLAADLPVFRRHLGNN